MNGRDFVGNWIRGGVAAVRGARSANHARRAPAATAVALLACLAVGGGLALARASQTKVTIGHLSDGLNTPVIASGRGISLYESTGDRHGRSSCYGHCAKVWQPYLAHGRLVAGKGVKQRLLGKTRRRNGSYQVTYNHHPLYMFQKDQNSPGAWDGEGCGSSGGGDANRAHPHWWLLTAGGRANKNEQSACGLIYQH